MRKWPNTLGLAAWSPDGKTIATVALESQSGIPSPNLIAVSVQSGRERLVTSGRWAAIADLEWALDGRGLIANTMELTGGRKQIVYISYPKGEIREITNDLNDYEGVSLEADSRTLATIQEKSSFDVWVARTAESGNAKPITSGGVTARARWSPDGKLVYDKRGGRGETNIWLLDSRGAHARQLTFSNAWNPQVTTDGRYIVFASDRTGMAHIWRMEIDGNSPKQLTDSPLDQLRLSSPDCTPDGKWVVYTKDGPEWGVWKVSIQGGDPVRLNSTQFAFYPAVSPNGRMLAYDYLDASAKKSGVAIMSLGESTTEKRFDMAAGTLRWANDSLSVLYVKNERGVSNIWSQPISGALPKQVTHLTRACSHYRNASMMKAK